MQSLVKFNFYEEKSYLGQDNLQNSENVKIVIDYLEEDSDYEQLNKLIQHISQVQSLELIIEELDLFVDLTLKKHLQYLVQSFSKLTKLAKFKFVIKAELNFNYSYFEINDFFFQNSILKQIHFKIFGFDKYIILKLKRSENCISDTKLSVKAKNMPLNAEYFDYFQLKKIKLIELKVKLFPSSCKNLGEFLKQQDTVQKIFIEIQKINYQSQSQDLLGLLDAIQYCINVNDLHINLDCNPSIQLFLALGKSMQQISSIKNLEILFKSDYIDADQINQNEQIELSKGIQNQKYFTTFKTNLSPINCWGSLNLKELQELSIHSQQTFQQNILAYSNDNEENLKEQINIFNCNVQQFMTNLSSFNKIQILDLQFPEQFKVSNESLSKFYDALNEFVNLTILKLCFESNLNNQDGQVLFGDSLQNCKELKEIDLSLSNNQYQLDVSAIQIFCQSLKGLQQIEKIKMNINNITLDAAFLLFCSLNEVVKIYFGDGYDVSFFIINNMQRNLNLQYQKLSIQKTNFWGDICFKSQYERSQSNYFDEGVSLLKNVQNLIFQSKFLHNENMIQSIQKFINNNQNTNKILFELSQANLQLLNDISLQFSTNLTQLFLTFCDNQNANISNILKNIQNLSQLTKFGISIYENLLENPKELIQTLQNTLKSMQMLNYFGFDSFHVTFINAQQELNQLLEILSSLNGLHLFLFFDNNYNIVDFKKLDKVIQLSLLRQQIQNKNKVIRQMKRLVKFNQGFGNEQKKQIKNILN